ncbi:hypothetical protein GKZ28_11200 [Clostridium chromiireducens]|jgi:hypothetical protein|uniref:Uncharacterized protein n=1 Tax=Clostridium chromiireducens TaxID=225345 RepID=A0A964RM89_9CLOT|nr:hypothetical protein [Clostridium chromiireducens]MVX64257.1 hypothetical protein [Clostridium chromiireducens]
MDLRDIRSKGESGRLLGKVLLEKNDILISIKGRDDKEPVDEGLYSSLEPYMDENQKKIIKQIINDVYIKKMQEINPVS